MAAQLRINVDFCSDESNEQVVILQNKPTTLTLLMVTPLLVEVVCGWPRASVEAEQILWWVWLDCWEGRILQPKLHLRNMNTKKLKTRTTIY